MSRRVVPGKPGPMKPGMSQYKGRQVTRPAETPQAALLSGTKWLVIASGKGGTSKTTTTLNLATVAAASGLRVAVLDTDEQATFSKWHARRETFRGKYPDEAVPLITLFSRPLGDLKKLSTRSMPRLELTWLSSILLLVSNSGC